MNQDFQAWQSAEVKAAQSDDQAQGQVNSDKVQWQNAKASLSALESGSTTAQQIEMDESQVDIAQVGVTNAEAAVAATTLKAPEAGVVEEVNVTSGEEVSSGGTGGASASGSSTHAVVVITPGAFEVTGSVSDALVNEIAVGQTAEVVAAGSSDAVAGKVTEVAEEATVTSGVATFPVTVVLSGASPSLRPGMSASVTRDHQSGRRGGDRAHQRRAHHRCGDNRHALRQRQARSGCGHSRRSRRDANPDSHRREGR